jgi:hypothetical protein
MTNLNRIATNGKSGAAITAVGLGVDSATPSDPFYRALRRIHKKEVLQLCEEYSRSKGLRLKKRVLP